MNDIKDTAEGTSYVCTKHLKQFNQIKRQRYKREEIGLQLSGGFHVNVHVYVMYMYMCG